MWRWPESGVRGQLWSICLLPAPALAREPPESGARAKRRHQEPEPAEVTESSQEPVSDLWPLLSWPQCLSTPRPASSCHLDNPEKTRNSSSIKDGGQVWIQDFWFSNTETLWISRRKQKGGNCRGEYSEDHTPHKFLLVQHPKVS